MEDIILISYLNDFIFCPISIYFHNLYGSVDTKLYQEEVQINGKYAHKSIDEKTYSSRKNILQSIDIYTSEYGILGKIDIFDVKSGILTERKNYIAKVYDGYVFQLYAQYYALTEMGYEVKKMRLHSIKDNKNYDVKLPLQDESMYKKFKKIVKEIREFNIESFEQTNEEKCKKCIYESICSRSKNVK